MDKITDMSLHYGAASPYSGIDTKFMYESGIVSLMIFHPCKHNVLNRGDGNYNNIMKQMKKWRKEGKENYKQSFVEQAKVTQCVLSAYSKGEDAKDSDLKHKNGGRMRGRVTRKMKYRLSP